MLWPKLAWIPAGHRDPISKREVPRLGLRQLVSGKVDGTLISYTQEKQAQKLGLVVIPLPLEYVQGLMTTQRPYLERNRKTVKAFLQGFVRIHSDIEI
jgi:hypothetical protein